MPIQRLCAPEGEHDAHQVRFQLQFEEKRELELQEQRQQEQLEQERVEQEEVSLEPPSSDADAQRRRSSA